MQMRVKSGWRGVVPSIGNLFSAKPPPAQEQSARQDNSSQEQSGQRSRVAHRAPSPKAACAVHRLYLRNLEARILGLLALTRTVTLAHALPNYFLNVSPMNRTEGCCHNIALPIFVSRFWGHNTYLPSPPGTEPGLWSRRRRPRQTSSRATKAGTPSGRPGRAPRGHGATAPPAPPGCYRRGKGKSRSYDDCPRGRPVPGAAAPGVAYRPFTCHGLLVNPW